LPRAFQRYLNRRNRLMRSRAINAAVPCRQYTRVPPGPCSPRVYRRATRHTRQSHRRACHSPGKPAFASGSRRVPPRLCTPRVYRRAARHTKPGSLASVPTTAIAIESRRLRPDSAVSRRGCAVPESIGEQHATPGQAVAPTSRTLPGKAGVCGLKPPCPAGAVQSYGSAGEQLATPGNRASLAAVRRRVARVRSRYDWMRLCTAEAAAAVATPSKCTLRKTVPSGAQALLCTSLVYRRAARQARQSHQRAGHYPVKPAFSA